MYDIELHYLTIYKNTFILYTFLFNFISKIIFLTLQRDIKQSLIVLALLILFMKRYFEWARSFMYFLSLSEEF